MPMNTDRKHIEVVAAIIRDEDGRIFATQRGYGEWKDWWEFPGGKIEVGEAPQQALQREIREELAAEIEVGQLLRTIDYDYPAFHLTMHCFLCRLIGYVTLLELRKQPLFGATVAVRIGDVIVPTIGRSLALDLDVEEYLDVVETAEERAFREATLMVLVNARMRPTPIYFRASDLPCRSNSIHQPDIFAILRYCHRIVF